MVWIVSTLHSISSPVVHESYYEIENMKCLRVFGFPTLLNDVVVNS